MLNFFIRVISFAFLYWSFSEIAHSSSPPQWLFFFGVISGIFIAAIQDIIKDYGKDG